MTLRLGGVLFPRDLPDHLVEGTLVPFPFAIPQASTYLIFESGESTHSCLVGGCGKIHCVPARRGSERSRHTTGIISFHARGLCLPRLGELRFVGHAIHPSRGNDAAGVRESMDFGALGSRETTRLLPWLALATLYGIRYLDADDAWNRFGSTSCSAFGFLPTQAQVKGRTVHRQGPERPSARCRDQRRHQHAALARECGHEQPGVQRPHGSHTVTAVQLRSAVLRAIARGRPTALTVGSTLARLHFHHKSAEGPRGTKEGSAPGLRPHARDLLHRPPERASPLVTAHGALRQHSDKPVFVKGPGRLTSHANARARRHLKCIGDKPEIVRVRALGPRGEGKKDGPHGGAAHEHRSGIGR